MAKKRIIFFALCLLLFQLSGFVALAPSCSADLWGMQEGLGKESTGDIGQAFGQSETDVRVVTVKLIKVFLTFLGIIFIILMIYGGFKWMTSRGKEDEVRGAQAIIKAAIIGFIIVLAAYVIANFVANTIASRLYDSQDAGGEMTDPMPEPPIGGPI